jgi:hypothetical protein
MMLFASLLPFEIPVTVHRDRRRALLSFAPLL